MAIFIINRPGDVRTVVSQASNHHSQCVGSLPKGTVWKGETLQEVLFLYADGSEDGGHTITRYPLRRGI